MPDEQNPNQPDSMKPDPFEAMRSDPIHPDLLELARQTFDEEDFLGDMREIRETGGVQFEDFIGDIEKRVRGHE